MEDVTVSEFFSLVGELRKNQKRWVKLYKEGKVKTEECRAVSRDGRMLCDRIDSILNNTSHGLAVSIASLLSSIKEEKGFK